MTAFFYQLGGFGLSCLVGVLGGCLYDFYQVFFRLIRVRARVLVAVGDTVFWFCFTVLSCFFSFFRGCRRAVLYFPRNAHGLYLLLPFFSPPYGGRMAECGWGCPAVWRRLTPLSCQHWGSPPVARYLLARAEGDLPQP